jgi:hypothetical protein
VTNDVPSSAELVGDGGHQHGQHSLVWNYWLGGKDDEQVGDQIAAAMPQIIDLARAVRGFVVRAVTYLAGEMGIR